MINSNREGSIVIVWVVEAVALIVKVDVEED